MPSLAVELYRDLSSAMIPLSYRGEARLDLEMIILSTAKHTGHKPRLTRACMPCLRAAWALGTTLQIGYEH